MQATLIRSPLIGFVLAVLASLPVNAVTITDKPAYLNPGVPPLVMLALTKDHQLYNRAYNDFTDLDSNGTLETTYDHTFSYYGYFDPNKCYKYDTSLKYFVPIVAATNKYCVAGIEHWSGNFLNWGSMTRMDVLRRLLYGGTRSTDPTSAASATILERVYLPMDAHAFAKYYNGTDINKLTPFSVSNTAPTGTSTSSSTIGTTGTSNSNLSVGTGSKVFNTTMTGVAIGDQVHIARTSDNTKYMLGNVTATTPGTSITVMVSTIGAAGGPYNNWTITKSFNTTMTGVVIGAQVRVEDSADNTKFMQGNVTAISAGTISVNVTLTNGAGTLANWIITDYSQTGITLCNTTYAASTQHSHSLSTTTYPPLIRVAKGNYSMWNANERWQCTWSSEHDASNGNAYIDADTGIPAYPSSPATTQGLFVASLATKADYVARVQVCKTGLLESNCKAYPSGNNKPTGLLQKYGDDGTIKYGLMTGSYSKNISGGVLRKNTSDMTDEVNVLTNGTFTGTAGIVKTINSMRLYGYDYSQGYYNADDTCTYQQTGMVTSGGANLPGLPANEGNCSNWGNPMSEIYLETLRYFAGQSPTAAFIPGAGSKDATLGLTVGTWVDPLSTTNYCSPLNVIVINASSASYDDDQMSGISDLGAASSAAALTKIVGDGEGITGNAYFVGNDGATNNGLCTGKTVNDLGAVTGICPDTPSIKGTFLMAGTAWYAHTNKIRAGAVAAAVPADDIKSLKATTYAIQLASNTPTISIAVPGSATQTVTLIPAFRLDYDDNGAKVGTGTLVDFKVIKPYTLSGGTATGSFLVNWEDSAQGGDYDQDVWGILSYSITATTITVSTKIIEESTNKPQGFGYIISGTTKDGAHFHSGMDAFDYTDPTGVTACSNCQKTDATTSVAYTIGTGSAAALKDPLWYAAKWGGFVDYLSGIPATGDDKPLLTSEWDSKTTTGAAGADSIPDTYFYVINPAELENALQNALYAILAESSASAVATNSTSLRTTGLIFQAKFNSKDWSGQVLAYEINTSGQIILPHLWDAADQVNTQALSNVTLRNIITLNKDDGKGMPFTWASISSLSNTTQMDFLNADGGGAADGNGSLRVNFLRGDQSQAGAGKIFRERSTSRLGDITFSNPQYVGLPNDGHFGSTYATFRTTSLNRTPVLYVGANDGMLHGFNACYPANGTTCKVGDQGKELIAYVPSKAYSNLSKLTDPLYSHKFFVDGSPTINDAEGAFGNCASSPCWRSVLVSGLNAGGQGVFALDVTDPSQFAEGNAATLLLWEFTDADDVLNLSTNDLGYTYSKPIIARVCTTRAAGVCTASKWVAIFGNGYNSATGTAALYVLYLDKTLGTAWTLGTNYFKIDTGCTASPCAPAAGGNGLSSIAGWDNDGDGNIDFVYGGDLQGNFWKFDLSGTPSLAQAAGWKVAIGGSAPYTPLFTAVDQAATPNRQPITTAPAVSAHPQYGGTLALFGTGKVLNTADIADLSVQTFYAIWDKNDGSTVSGRSVLLEQQITTEDNTAGNRTTSANTMNWKTATSTAPHYLGWYMDLIVAPPPTVANMKGERHVGTPKLINGVVLFNSYIPSTALCDFGGDGWFFALNYADGGLLPYPPFDSNNDGSITSSDPPTGAKKVGAALGGTTYIGGGGIASGASGVGISSNTKGGTKSTLVQTKGLRGRVTWRELIPN